MKQQPLNPTTQADRFAYLWLALTALLGLFTSGTDPYGRLLAHADHFKNECMMQVNVPTAGTPTIYPQIGNIVGQLSVIGFILIALWTIVASRFLHPRS